MRALTATTASLLLILGACASDDVPERVDQRPTAPAPAAAAEPTAAPALIPSGLSSVPPIQVRGVKAGTGERAEAGQTVAFHYTGTLLNGEQFDSSRGGSPFEFQLGKGRVIKGWDLVAAEMRVGDRWIVTIPPRLAYGERGAPPVIPGNATLVFDMEFVAIR